MAGLTNNAVIIESMQKHFKKELLDRIIPSLTFVEFAMKSDLPSKSGATSMRMFRFGPPSLANVQKIQHGRIPPDSATGNEGVPLAASTYRQLQLEYLEVKLDQYVQTISIPDVTDAISLFNLLDQANTQNAEDAALHCDTLTQFELAGNTGTVDNINYTTKNYIYAGAATDYATAHALGAFDADNVLTSTDILDAATALKINNAPKINGSYVLCAPPQITRDIMEGASTKTVWVDVSKYSAPQQLFNGEVGKLYGVRVIEHTNAYRGGATDPGQPGHLTDNPQANYSATGNVYSSFAFGRNSYGISDLATLGSPYSPQVHVVTGADKSDPANLIRALVSWKAFWAAKVIQPKWMVHIFSQSGYGATP